MPIIKSARAFANNAVAYVAWDIDPAGLAGCLGFEITRVYKATGEKRCLAAWVPFEGQSNPNWHPQDTSVWPVQKFTWRDLTIRQRRDDANLRPSDETVFYRIRPVCNRRDGLVAVTVTLDPGTYKGKPRPLSYMDEGEETNEVTPTSNFGPMKVAFNNGILSTQWLTRAIETGGQKATPQAVSREISNPQSAIRHYLAGDLPNLMQEIFRDLKDGENLYLALYELTDPVLLELITDNAPKVHLILSNTSLDKKTGKWDVENKPARDALHAAKPKLAEMHDRMFSNSGHIGHNKFAVRVGADGKATKVLSGSTNWTPNGLCAQSNNSYIAELPALAEQFYAYWKDLKRDTENFVAPTEPGASTRNVQGQELRQEDATSLAPVMKDNWGLKLWRSPNTKQTTKPSASPALPPDLAEVFTYMRQAKEAIFFAVFLPSQMGATSIIEEAIAIARKDRNLLVYGAISDPMAMPNFIPPKTRQDPNDKYEPAVFEEGLVHVVRATALPGDLVGNFEHEVLSAGNAIIHDKIAVIDPLGAEPIVITGSHNLGYKASYANDDNLVIIRRNRAIAEAYMVHILDLYEHYRFRSVQAELQHSGKPAWGGFLHTDDSWAQKYAQGGSDLSLYLSSPPKEG